MRLGEERKDWEQEVPSPSLQEVSMEGGSWAQEADKPGAQDLT
jgi:hypothetical protein